MRMKKNETCITVIQLIKEQFIPICYFNTIWGLLLLGPSACTEAAIVSAALQVSSNYMAIFLKIKKKALNLHCIDTAALNLHCIDTAIPSTMCCKIRRYNTQIKIGEITHEFDEILDAKVERQFLQLRMLYPW